MRTIDPICDIGCARGNGFDADFSSYHFSSYQSTRSSRYNAGP
jgi:hypothetical protein